VKQWSAILVVLLTAGCRSASTSDPAADRQSIAAVSARFAAAENAGYVEEMLLLFAEDMIIMSPNAPAFSGTDRIAATTRAFHEAFAVQVEYRSEEIAAFGDWGFDRGTERFTLTPKSGGAPISMNGKYLWLYRRQPDGSWKQSRVMWNSSDPVPKGGI
jgi:ketosteroid isomerase-like protein